MLDVNASCSDFSSSTSLSFWIEFVFWAVHVLEKRLDSGRDRCFSKVRNVLMKKVGYTNLYSQIWGGEASLNGELSVDHLCRAGLPARWLERCLFSMTWQRLQTRQPKSKAEMVQSTSDCFTWFSPLHLSVSLGQPTSKNCVYDHRLAGSMTKAQPMVISPFKKRMILLKNS